jgi:hypothetical protein
MLPVATLLQGCMLVPYLLWLALYHTHAWMPLHSIHTHADAASLNTYTCHIVLLCQQHLLPTCALLQNTWGLFMALLQRCVLSPLAAHVSAQPLGAGAQQQLALCSTPHPEEESVVALLERSADKLHWSVRLCIARWAWVVGRPLCML